MHVSSVNIKDLITELQYGSYDPESTPANLKEMTACLSTLELKVGFQISRGLAPTVRLNF